MSQNASRSKSLFPSAMFVAQDAAALSWNNNVAAGSAEVAQHVPEWTHPHMSLRQQQACMHLHEITGRSDAENIPRFVFTR